MNKFLHSFWFHMIVAAAIVIVGWWVGILLVAVIFNRVWWIGREIWQKRHEPRRFFTLHVFLEWAAPLATSELIYGGLSWLS